MWERFHALKGGVLVVGHGTRIASGVSQLLDLSHQIQSFVPKIPTQASFLELAEPTIPHAMFRLREQNVRLVLVLPILLFEAGHAQSDIPEAVRKAAECEGISVLAQSPPLGTADAALALSEFRFSEALRCRNLGGCLTAGGCSQVSECLVSTMNRDRSTNLFDDGDKIGLAMVGRGTSDPIALEHMRRFTALRVENSKIPVSWVQTGFFAGGEPKVDQLLKNAASSNCTTIVVQPHLLFEGELIRQLREKVELYQQNSTNCRWLVTPTLGADPNLAKAFFTLAEDTLERHFVRKS